MSNSILSKEEWEAIDLVISCEDEHSPFPSNPKNNLSTEKSLKETEAKVVAQPKPAESTSNIKIEEISADDSIAKIVISCSLQEIQSVIKWVDSVK